MPDLPTLEQGLATLLKENKNLEPAMQQYVPAKEFAQQVAEGAPELTNLETIEAIRDEIVSTYEKSKLGHLLTRYELNRDKQMAVLQGLGRDVILSLLAQGALPAEIAKHFSVSYDTFTEFMSLKCTPAELKRAERLGADSLMLEGLEALEDAEGRDDVAKARALMDTKFKLAKSMNHKYIEQKPSTAVQVNNYNEGGQQGDAPVPYLQIVEIDPHNLPPLPDHQHISKLPKPFEPDGIEDGEFELFQPDRDE